MQTVRDTTIDVLRAHDLTTLFANPGSTEVPFLTGLPEDLHFVLALHEGSVVGAATGFALARERPALVLLHTTAGLGNAVGALATARVNRAPLVVLVGQQDRRHLALEPFLAGHLTGLAGSYPVHTDEPVRAQDVPGAVARAWHAARDGRGPALVIVPMDDWDAPADPDVPVTAPRHVRRGVARPSADQAGELGGMLDGARSPVLVTGAGADSPAAWRALADLAERLACPVWQEPFGARAGFPQDHPRFAGHLPPERGALRAALAGHDVVGVVGAGAFRLYPFEDGPLLTEGTHLVVVTDDPAEAYRSPADTVILADPGETVSMLAARVSARAAAPAVRPDPPSAPPPGPGEPLLPRHVFDALAVRLPQDTVLVEETPSSRPDLHAIIPARAPMGFLSAAMGGLGFALPAAAGLAMSGAGRPVVALIGDGAALYGIQSLWTAAYYGAGLLAVVLDNGRYAVMDRLAGLRGTGDVPWPAFEEVSVAGLARSLGCEAIELSDLRALGEVLDEVLPSLAERGAPLLLDVAVAH